uniref:Adipose-secreted signaling protein n=1 Tax=Arion vulgaris TaxID=1028688 RepID=A0A0B6ZZY7_9EUPU
MAESNSDTLDNNITHKKAHHHHTHRAHFVEPHKQDDLDAHDSKIVVEPLGHETVNVRLGFLQVKHTYEVHFTIEDGLGEDVTFDPLENLHAKFQSVNPSEDGKGHEVVLRFSAAKEKIMQESVTIRSKDDNSKRITLQLHARVLGKGKGTPSLKEGIHCVRIDGDEDTDDSDWQGF